MPTRDCWGQFCYVRDVTDDRIWSIGHQPLCAAADEYEFELSRRQSRVSTAGRRRGNALGRLCRARCRLRGARGDCSSITAIGRCEVELTSFAEICLNHRRADQAHPAFAKLFLETQFDANSGALLVRRRPRGANENPVWAMHVSAASTRGERNNRVRDGSCELSRARSHFGEPRGPGLRGAFVADDRSGAGSRFQLATARAPRARSVGAGRVRDRSGRHPGGGDRDSRTIPRS